MESWILLSCCGCLISGLVDAGLIGELPKPGRLNSPHREVRPEGKSSLGNGFCMSANEACFTMFPGGLNRNLLAKFNNTFNTMGCAERCEQIAECEVWTWWGDTKQCEIFSSCLTRSGNCADCQTGPRSCGLWDSMEAVVSGGWGSDEISPIEYEVTVIGNVSTINTTLTLPSCRWGHVSVTLGFLYYVCGGSSGIDERIAPNQSCDVYDASRGSVWSEGVPMLSARHGAAGVQLFGRMFVLGGLGVLGEYQTSVEAYDPRTKVWTWVTDLWAGLYGHCAVSVYDGIFVAGGKTNDLTVTAVTLFYNMTSNQWTPLPEMNKARSFHGCSIIPRANDNDPDQEIIVSGGLGKPYQDGNEVEDLLPMDSVEIFSFRTLSWRTFTSLPEPKAYHSQSTNRVVRLYGGVVDQIITDEVLELRGEEWIRSNIRLKTPTRSTSVALYPTDLIKPSPIV